MCFFCIASVAKLRLAFVLTIPSSRRLVVGSYPCACLNVSMNVVMIPKKSHVDFFSVSQKKVVDVVFGQMTLISL